VEGTLLLRHRLVVRFSDCDPLGHVNNAVYLTYLEQARIALWRGQAGHLWRDRAAVGNRGEGFILARAEVDFRSEAHDGDELEVRLSLVGFGRTSVTYGYEIAHVTSGRVVATAKTVVVWYDYGAGRPVPLTEENKAKLAAPMSHR
jgi:acyl-CoA thioester hydrolase